MQPLAGVGQSAVPDHIGAALGALAGPHGPWEPGTEGDPSGAAAGGSDSTPHVHVPLVEPVGLGLLCRRRRAGLQRGQSNRSHTGRDRSHSLPRPVCCVRIAGSVAPQTHTSSQHEAELAPYCTLRVRYRT